MVKYTSADAWKIFIELFSLKWLKAAVAIPLAAVLNWVAGAPAAMQKLLLAAAVLIVVDIFSGILASVFVKRRRISSAVFRRTLIKVAVYGLVMVLGCLVDLLVGNAYIVTTLIVGIVVATEGISCLENLRAVWEKLGYKWPFDFLGDAFRKISPEVGGSEEFKNGTDED